MVIIFLYFLLIPLTYADSTECLHRFPINEETSFEMNKIKYHFSKPVMEKKGGKYYVVAYCGGGLDPWYPRVFYKSMSGGSWRSAIYFTKERPHRVGKGLGLHYTQETRVHEKFIFKLDEILDKRRTLGELKRVRYNDLLYCADKTKDTMYTFPIESTMFDYHDNKLDRLIMFRPGKYHTEDCQRFSNIRETFRNFEYPAEFLPDFKEVVRTYQYEHHLLGRTVVEVFIGKLAGRDVEWHMAHAWGEHYWIDSINFTDSKITSYGTHASVINSGVLTNKPIEYCRQLSCIEESVQHDGYRPPVMSGNDRYCDLREALGELRPIRDYKEVRAQMRKREMCVTGYTIFRSGLGPNVIEHLLDDFLPSIYAIPF